MNLTGTYELKNYQVEMQGKDVSPNFPLKARLVYSDSGDVTVSFRLKKPEGEDHYFYTGNYELRGDEVIHHVKDSSRSEEIGRSFYRTWEIPEKGILILKGTKPNGEEVTVTWLRVSFL